MNRALFVVLLAVVAAGLTWGFTIVGGPGFARMEANDRTRASHLRVLGTYYACANYQLSEADKAISPTYCARGDEAPPDVKDPATGAPYRFTEEGETQFRVCATFEMPASQRRGNRTRNRVVYDGQEGCVVYVRGSATSKWFQDTRG